MITTLPPHLSDDDDLTDHQRSHYPFTTTILFPFFLCLYYISDGVLGVRATHGGSLYWLGLVAGQINL